MKAKKQQTIMRVTAVMIAFLIAFSLLIPALAVTYDYSSMSDDELMEMMATNSSAWGSADKAGKDALHNANNQIREELANRGNNVTYEGGATTVTNSSGNQIYNNYNTKDDNGNTQYGFDWTSSTGSYIHWNVNSGVGYYSNNDGIVSNISGVRVQETKADGTKTESFDVVYHTKNYEGEYVTVSQTQAISSAEQWCKEQGIPANETNIAAYISQHYTSASYVTDATGVTGTTIVIRDENGKEVTELDLTGSTSLAGMITTIMNSNSNEDMQFSAIWDQIKDVEESPEILALQTEYVEVQKSDLPEEKKKAELDRIHAEAEAIRAQYGYSGGENGDYYIPIENDPDIPKENIIVIPDIPDPVTLWTVTVTHSDGGAVTPGSGMFLEGTTADFNFIPDEGYHVTDVIVDGQSVGALDHYVLWNIKEAHTIHVEFKKGYSINVSWEGEGTVKASPDDGTTPVNKSYVTEITKGDSKTYVFTPASGYIVKDVLVDGVSAGNLSSYTFRNVDKVHYLHIVFKKQHQVTVTWEGEGTVTPDDIKVTEGEDQEFTFTPAPDYIIDDVIVDGKSVGNPDDYTLTDVDKPHTIHVVFKERHDIKVTWEGNGSVTPGTVKVTDGESQTFTIKPNKDNVIYDVLVDGRSVGKVSSYTFRNVSGDHTLHVVFKKEFTITVHWDGQGTVSPGTIKVVEGEDQTFTFTPAEGWEVKNVKVDGVSKPGITSGIKFENVSKGYDLYVRFKETPQLVIGDPSLDTDNLNDDGSIKAGYGFTAALPIEKAVNVEDIVVTASWNFGKGGTGNTILVLGADGKYHFPVNSQSVTGAQKIYIPVETLDGTYTITFVASGYDEDGEMVQSQEIPVQIRVKGTMYEDDFTGDRGNR